MKLGVTPLKPLAGGGETDYEVRGHPAEATGGWGRDRLLQDYKGLLNPRTFLHCQDKTSGTGF